jgi:hypothetical protein
MSRVFLLLAMIAAIAGCARAPVMPAGQVSPAKLSKLAECRQFFRQLDHAIKHAKVTDTQAVRVAGFPYLRADRFLASFRDQVTQQQAFIAWIDRLQRLAEQGYAVEIANLPSAERESLRQLLPAGLVHDRPLMDSVRSCGERLRSEDLTYPGTHETLRQAVQVPDEYVTWQRGVGLYFLTANATQSGIKKWHQRVHQVYAQPLEQRPVRGELVRYVPAPGVQALTPETIAETLQRSAQNALRIPEPTDEERERLFATFAPAWQIDVATDDDRLGTPFWPTHDADHPDVDVQDATVYRHLSHTRFGGDVLLQLNYIVWFRSRPKTSGGDYLGGHLDGIMWRVTLRLDGSPLVFDASHNCGCYQMFFPSPGVRVRPIPRTPDEDAQEPPLIPQIAPRHHAGVGPTLRIAHRTHYIERATSQPSGVDRIVTYRWADYATLRSLPLQGGGRRSLFRPDGIVPGTKRGERFFFWPMGVPHPGEMRQWGHHAIAFVGRRHFEDPYLMEQIFIPDESATTTPAPQRK